MDPQTLDLFILGPGFGESILIGWWENGSKHWGLVDCYAPNEGRAFIEWLKALGVEHLKFMILTHPHLDHIHNISAVLREYSDSIANVWWWGGLAPSSYIAFFAKLAAEDSVDSEYGLAAKSILEFFHERRDLAKINGKPAIEEVLQIQQLFPFPPDKFSVLRLLSLSPWPDPLFNFTTKLVNGIKPGVRASFQHRDANDVSIALLLQFGDAQILLGGDTETANWVALRSATVCPQIKPCIVKVSHHGSKNGSAEGMWEQRGFYGVQDPPPYAVITPWRNQLPDMAMVWKIAKACKAVYVTGRSKGPKRQFLSFVHFQVSNAGAAKLIYRSDNVKEYVSGNVHTP